MSTKTVKTSSESSKVSSKDKETTNSELVEEVKKNSKYIKELRDIMKALVNKIEEQEKAVVELTDEVRLFMIGSEGDSDDDSDEESEEEA